MATDELAELFGVRAGLSRVSPRLPQPSVPASILRHAQPTSQRGTILSLGAADPGALVEVERQLVFKVLLLGGPAVGKTSLRRVISTKQISRTYAPTIGVEVTKSKYGILHERTVFLQMWDVPHIELQSADSHLDLLFRGAHAALFVFDVTRPESLAAVDEWRDLVHRRGAAPPMLMFLLANKVDSSSTCGLSVSDLDSYTHACGYSGWFYTSALMQGADVQDATDHVVKLIASVHAKDVLLESQHAGVNWLTRDDSDGTFHRGGATLGEDSEDDLDDSGSVIVQKQDLTAAAANGLSPAARSKDASLIADRPTQLPMAPPLPVTVVHPGNLCVYDAHHAIPNTCATSAGVPNGPHMLGCCAPSFAAFPAPFTTLNTDGVTTRPRSAKFFRRAGMEVEEEIDAGARIGADGSIIQEFENDAVQTPPPPTQTATPASGGVGSTPRLRGRQARTAWEQALAEDHIQSAGGPGAAGKPDSAATPATPPHGSPFDKIRTQLSRYSVLMLDDIAQQLQQLQTSADPFVREQAKELRTQCDDNKMTLLDAVRELGGGADHHAGTPASASGGTMRTRTRGSVRTAEHLRRALLADLGEWEQALTALVWNVSMWLTSITFICARQYAMDQAAGGTLGHRMPQPLPLNHGLSHGHDHHHAHGHAGSVTTPSR